MRLEDLRPAVGSKVTRKRVGRGTGSGLGKTSGKLLYSAVYRKEALRILLVRLGQKLILTNSILLLMELRLLQSF